MYPVIWTEAQTEILTHMYTSINSVACNIYPPYKTAWYNYMYNIILTVGMLRSNMKYVHVTPLNIYFINNKFVIIFVIFISHANKLGRNNHDDVVKWKHFPRNRPFVQGIHRSLVNSSHKDQWRGALIFSLICAWINGWVNNHEAGDWRCHRAHYGVIVMLKRQPK